MFAGTIFIQLFKLYFLLGQLLIYLYNEMKYSASWLSVYNKTFLIKIFLQFKIILRIF